jgi:hypothetical protein
VIIKRPETAMRFHRVFSQMFMLSESLDHRFRDEMEPAMRYTTVERIPNTEEELETK